MQPLTSHQVKLTNINYSTQSLSSSQTKTVLWNVQLSYVRYITDELVKITIQVIKNMMEALPLVFLDWHLTSQSQHSHCLCRNVNVQQFCTSVSVCNTKLTLGFTWTKVVFPDPAIPSIIMHTGGSFLCSVALVEALFVSTSVYAA